MEPIDLGEEREDRLGGAPRHGCLAAGCSCKDARIVSPRRARFHAFLATTRGETADRVIAPDPDWPLGEIAAG